MTSKLITVKVKFTEAELDTLPQAKTNAGRVRLACNLQPSKHGGIRAGGFERGNKHNPKRKPKE